ncbi:MAG: hypothetical protein C5B56_07900 [Proteobacteria bacterium]|nr:MAG: hypothetical protein C5B56_07900 [Pseudomonadota bacterium]
MPRLVAVALLLLALMAPAAHADKRVALVIGNGAYQKVGALPNPVRDAEAVEALFRAAGFDVVEARRDVGLAVMRRALRDFADRVRDADIAVVFYAGHGIEVNGTNYLIPVDAALERDIDVEDETVPLDRIIQILDQAKRLRLVILDACRDNPFARSMRRTVAGRSIGRGFAKVDVLTSDTLVAFAARHGSTAADGEGANSPYTTALVKHLTTPGLDLRLALGRVRDEVLRSTSNRQEPFVYGSLGGAEIPLVPVSNPQIALGPQTARLTEAAEAWDRTKDSASVTVLEAFIARYKDSFYADLARARIEELKRQQVAVVAPSAADRPAASGRPLQEPRPAPSLRSAAADVAERVMPVVASIQVKIPAKPANPPNPNPPTASGDASSAKDSAPTTIQASGFLVSEDGLVVTSYATLESAQEISVTVGGIKYKAKALAGHAETDLALLKIDSDRKFPRVAFSERYVAAGESVLSLGNPYGLGGSARLAKVRGWQKIGELIEGIQLERASIKGESGAPLFDTAGEVIGVAYGARADATNGLAVPANVAVQVIDQLRRSGAVTDQAALGKEISRTRGLSAAASGFATETPPDLWMNARKGVVSVVGKATGSGFVIDGKEGIIVTTLHLVAGADNIVVTLYDGTKLKVDKVLKDAKTDLAILKVTANTPLPALAFGASSKLRIGERVAAMNDPLRPDGAVVVGILSSKNRDLSTGPYDDYLQYDMVLARSTSGAPVFNLAGEVVGVHTVIVSPNSTGIGLSFAVPSELATFVVNQLRQYGETRRGWFGANIQGVTEEVTRTSGVNTGALVAAVNPDTPAFKAGVQTGDVILKFDGKDLTSFRDLPRLVAQTPIGRDVDVELWRKGQRMTLKLTVGRLSE